MKRLLIIGAGGHGLVVADAARETGLWQEIAFLDDRFPALRENLLGPVLGPTETLGQWRRDYPALVVAIGDPGRRLEFLIRASAAGYELPAVIHPAAWVSQTATVGPGAVVMAQAAVQTAAVIGRGCIVNTGASVDHECRLDEGVHVAPRATLGGNVGVGSLTWVGIGATVREGITIGGRVLVAAGAVVVADVAEGSRVMGVPAREKGANRTVAAGNESTR